MKPLLSMPSGKIARMMEGLTKKLFVTFVIATFVLASIGLCLSGITKASVGGHLGISLSACTFAGAAFSLAVYCAMYSIRMIVAAGKREVSVREGISGLIASGIGMAIAMTTGIGAIYWGVKYWTKHL